MVKIGIIGGSGLEDPNILKDAQDKQVYTEHGNARITIGRIGKVGS